MAEEERRDEPPAEAFDRTEAETLDPGPVEEELRPPVRAQPCILRERFVINPNKPIPELSSPHAKAYAVEDRKESVTPLFALVCERSMPVRTNAMRAIKGVKSPGMMRLVEWGIVLWPIAGGECLAAVFERPRGVRVMNDLRDQIVPLTEHNVIPRLIEPVTLALRELSTRGVTHRAIRPTNMYYVDGDRTLLGDCVTAPPAYDQPLLFEPIESGMANPIGRGTGTYADDMYAFGVSLTLMLLGFNPVARMDDAALLRQKMQSGTYAALVGEERIHFTLIELLRGLLSDNPDQRWDIDNLEMWLAGRRMAPQQSRVDKRATRGFPFEGTEYFHARELAHAMGKHWDQAIATVVEGKLELWLQRALEEKDKAKAIAKAVATGVAGSAEKRASLDIMMCKILTLLDPLAPIRYKGMVAMPDGLGACLAMVMAKREEPRLLAEVLLREIPAMWMETRLMQGLDDSRISINFQNLRAYLAQTGMGFGLERCLYEMNESMPCQSPLLTEDYVADLKQLLPALNAAAAKRKDSKQWPVDRHIAAFMGARFRSDIDRHLGALNEKDPVVAFLALLNLLAVFQYRTGQANLQHLSMWLVMLATPLVQRYHSRGKRQEMEKDLGKLARAGSIVEIYNLLENNEALTKDMSDFLWAQAQFQAAEEEIRELDDDGEERSKESELIGRQTATMIAILIAFFTLLGVVISKFW